MTYSVVVENVGTVYDGTNGFEARVAFNHYIGQSKRGEGRAAGEPVFLMNADEIVKKHQPNEVSS